ncbi:transposase [Sorangium sp. So ce429]
MARIYRAGKNLKDVRVTQDEAAISAVVLAHDKRMKEPWCLATSRADLTGSQVVKLYGRRFCIEETFRDIKNVHFGMGLSATHIKDTARRDRLLLISAFAHVLLTLLGEAGERAGLDRLLKTNTVKHRTLSLYNQGCYWYTAIPNMREERLVQLMAAYGEVLREHAVTREIFGII